MRFSVLLPTRNGGEYLNDVIASVLAQSCDDMELVVSDNASDPETRDVIARFSADSRLKYVRLDRVVTVTENWNHAVSVSRGRYLVLIGDDDYLLPTCLSTLASAIERHDEPDCITFNGLTFVFPGALEGQTIAWFTDSHFQFGDDFVPDSELSQSFRRELVKDMFRFRVRFPLNMQLTAFSRRAAHLLGTETFRAPFPDHFALNSMLLVADRFVYIPDHLVVVGVSPKSFGHYYYGGDQRAGVDYLGLGVQDDGRLPGSELLNYMREWLGLLKKEYPDLLRDVQISHWNYVGRQVHHWTRDYEFRTLDSSELIRRAKLLSWSEQLQFFLPLVLYRSALRGLRSAGLRSGDRFTDMLPRLRPVSVDGVRQFAGWAAAHGLT